MMESFEIFLYVFVYFVLGFLSGHFYLYEILLTLGISKYSGTSMKPCHGSKVYFEEIKL